MKLKQGTYSPIVFICCWFELEHFSSWATLALQHFSYLGSLGFRHRTELGFEVAHQLLGVLLSPCLSFGCQSKAAKPPTENVDLC